ncbi:SH2 domain-containing adapter protein E [Bagarius yarrelli]|uniref:SH2 domain-containing adapter protein E n=1 Tax=Bagarius yarrelli TaxID=175774 RepID=A0A556V9Z3_BAGYA|nr:SH2 domain-containing adapter protein E [Bagarius yarrelli]
MAKWFKDFPTLKTGSDRLRSASESGAQTRPRAAVSSGTGAKASPRKNSENAGGVGSLLSGRNRKNSAVELGRNHSSPGSVKDAKIWEILIPGKSKKNVKMEGFEDHRTLRTSGIADAYMSRMIKVEKQDKWQERKYSSAAAEGTGSDMERGKTPVKTETLIILEDYADPFDAEKTREQREAEREGENDGYMEPYDAQLIITEIRRRGSKDLLKVCVVLNGGEGEGSGSTQIYDVPYEEVLEGIPLTRPESDPRPPAEYELPWEWKKEQIVRALSAQFEGVERLCKEDASSTGVKQQNLRSVKSWNPKSLRLSPPSSPKSIPDTENQKVDPTVPLELQSIPEVVHHYCTQRLPFTGAEHMTLQHPVPRTH